MITVKLAGNLIRSHPIEIATHYQISSGSVFQGPQLSSSQPKASCRPKAAPLASAGLELSSCSGLKYLMKFSDRMCYGWGSCTEARFCFLKEFGFGDG